MADKRELARREALEIWLVAVRFHGNDVTEQYMRDAELAFDKWWRSLSRRDLKRRAGRR